MAETTLPLLGRPGLRLRLCVGVRHGSVPQKSGSPGAVEVVILPVELGCDTESFLSLCTVGGNFAAPIRSDNQGVRIYIALVARRLQPYLGWWRREEAFEDFLVGNLYERRAPLETREKKSNGYQLDHFNSSKIIQI